MSERIQRLRRRAAEYVAQGQLGPAAVTYESLLREVPHDDLARLDLARLRLHEDRYCDALALTLDACQRELASPALALPRLEALRVFAEHARMIDLARAVSTLDAISTPDLTMGAATLESIGATEFAQAWIDAALRRAPDDPMALANRAMIAIDRGDFDRAQFDLERVAEGPGLVAMAHWLLARLRRQTEGSNHVERLSRCLARSDLQPIDEANLAFALHKELDDLGRHDAAWVALERACAAKRRGLDYDDAEMPLLVDALIARFDASMATPAHAAASDEPVPIFIVGMYRSGTTLLERILEAHPQVAGGGESQRFAAQLRHATDHHSRTVVDRTVVARADRVDPAELGRRHLAAYRHVSAGRSHYTEKHPAHFLAVGFIRQALPHARVLHLVRDPMDTCWSNLRELFANQAAPYSYDQGELGRYHRQYQRVMAHWHRMYPGFVHDVSYEALVRDPEGTARKVFAHCGLAWHAGSTAVEQLDRPVRTASAVQVREPIHARSLGRWTPYALQLQTLRTIVAPGGAAAD